ncbi:MAG: DUF1122 family protein [Dehalococcoidia bacterium]
MTASHTARWRPAAESPDHPLTRLDGVGVGEDVTLAVLLGPKNSVGATYFRLYLESSEFGRTVDPVVFGLQNSGPFPGFNWVEIIEWQDVLPLHDGRSVQVPEGIERLLFARLGELIPPGGHLMAEYDSPARTITARALAARVPPAATPLGSMLRSAGCGDAYRDWYISEGGREGPRKLQGFRALDEAHAARRAAEMVEALEAFLADESDLDWNVLAQARPLAEGALLTLRPKAAKAARETPN